MPTLRSLRALFAFILVAMLGIIGWASSRCALFDIPRDVFTHPWFIATLFDAYFAFIAFWVWVAWKEGACAARLLWLVALILWGNVGIAAYMLFEIARVRREGGDAAALFTRQRPGSLPVPVTLVIVGLAVYLLGAKNVLLA